MNAAFVKEALKSAAAVLAVIYVARQFPVTDRIVTRALNG